MAEITHKKLVLQAIRRYPEKLLDYLETVMSQDNLDVISSKAKELIAPEPGNRLERLRRTRLDLLVLANYNENHPIIVEVDKAITQLEGGG